MDENKGEKQNGKARRKSLLQSSRQVGRRFFLKVAGLGLAHFALINAAFPKEALGDLGYCTQDLCVAHAIGNTDSCVPSSGDEDNCSIIGQPYYRTDVCLTQDGDTDHCGEERTIDVCQPNQGDPDHCTPGAVDMSAKDDCEPSIGDVDVCDPEGGEPVTPAATSGPPTTVPPEGGTADDGNGTKVVLPPGAVSQPTDIYILRPSYGYPSTEDGKRIVVTRQFAPDGIEFNAPVEITIPCSSSEAAGLEEDSLGAYLLDGNTGRWQPVPAVREGSPLTGYRLKITTTHFSIYGIGGTLPPVSASKNWALALLGFLGLAILGRFGWWREEKTETEE